MSQQAMRVTDMRVSAYKVPTDLPEADGTLTWNSTTMVLVEAFCGHCTGVGYTYSAAAVGRLINDALVEVVVGSDAMAVTANHAAMVKRLRNQGSGGLSRMAVSAVDTALWDLKARLLNLPLVSLLGQLREMLPVYGSGGFTNFSVEKLCEQLGGWVERGMSRVKMKVGSDPSVDPQRIEAAREAIGPDTDLMMDGNHAYDRKQALRFMYIAGDYEVKWFEQPLAPQDLEGARLLRDRAPAGMEIADGEYASDSGDFLRLLQAGAADILMPDITRCGGVTGLLQAAEVCAAWGVPISTHCAPALHLHPGCALRGLRHGEYFQDHARIEQMLFDGNPEPARGALHPDLSALGNGLVFRHADAERFLVYRSGRSSKE